MTEGPKEATAQEAKVARILARAAVARSPDYPNWPASHTGGVMPMSIVGRFENERERLGPDFTEQDRQWRIKWHKDQILHPSEPRPVPELERKLTNPIRRFYKRPLDYVEHQVLAPKLGTERAWLVRNVGAKVFLGYVGILYAWYSLKYNHNTWEKYWGWRISYGRPSVLPGDPHYPLSNPRPNNEDYCDREFSKRKVFMD